MSDITRIMDLPENISLQMTPGARGDGMQQMTPGARGDSMQNARGDGINTSYSPMDIHPNPYGHPPPSIPSMPPQSAGGGPQHQQQQQQQQQQQRLPSRDIPQDQSYLVQDPEVIANYIQPVSRNTAEYMRQHEETSDKNIEAHKRGRETKTRMDKLAEDGQIPILIAMLFFIFHMPVVDTYLVKSFSFLAINDVDGNFNMNGLIMRSVFFGFLFHGVTYLINTLTLL